MKFWKYEVNQRDVIFWAIFIFAGITALILIIELANHLSVEVVNTLPQDFFSNVANACINTSSFFLATIFAVYAILVTLDKTVPNKLLYVAIFPILAIILGIFALIGSYFAATLPIAICFLGISLMFTIGTLAWIYLLIDFPVRQKVP